LEALGALSNLALSSNGISLNGTVFKVPAFFFPDRPMDVTSVKHVQQLPYVEILLARQGYTQILSSHVN
jgi:hypothetical protein